MANLTAQQRQDLIEELPRLKRFCLSLTSDPADADDLLQITVERLLEKGMPEDAHVAKWSHRVCRNCWIDEIRSRDVRSRYALSESAVEGAGTTSANTDESVCSNAHHRPKYLVIVPTVHRRAELTPRTLPTTPSWTSRSTPCSLALASREARTGLAARR